jgi:KDO2-lipid IV(A) lauroyltransferase
MPDSGSAMSPVPAGLRARYALARAVFFLVYQLFGLRRRVIRDNLARSFPGRTPGELRRIRREFVARQSELLAELDYARVIGAEELRARVHLRDPGALLQGDGRLLLLTGHQCNFEWALLRMSLEFGDGLIGLYKPMNGKWAERYVLGVR